MNEPNDAADGSIASNCYMGIHLTPGGSSKTIVWETPRWLFDALDKEFGFTLDVCATADNAKCDRFFTEADNGLLKDWGTEVCWMNPPYGREIGEWMAKANNAANMGATVVVLIPARTDTEWWHKYAMKHEIRFLRGRLKFGEATEFAPFPSAIIVMRPVTFKLCSM
mgnify:FL=1